MSSREEIRRALGWVLVGSLCVAAATAIFAILGDSFDDTDWRVIGMSIGFAVFSSTGASGATLRVRTSESLRTLGLVTMALSALAFLLLVVALWNDDSDSAWRWWGVTGLAAFSASHASLVQGARRDTDSDAIRVIATASIAFSVLDSGVGILAIAEAFEDVDEGFARFVGVVVILLVLTTALPPIMRRLQREGGPSAPAGPARPEQRAAVAVDAAQGTAPAPAPLASEVITAVDRILALNSDPGNRAPEIRRECERLRELARSYSR